MCCWYSRMNNITTLYAGYVSDIPFGNILVHITHTWTHDMMYFILVMTKNTIWFKRLISVDITLILYSCSTSWSDCCWYYWLSIHFIWQLTNLKKLSLIHCMYRYHNKTSRISHTLYVYVRQTRPQASLIRCMYRYHLQNLRDLSYIVCIGTINKNSRISHSLYV